MDREKYELVLGTVMLVFGIVLLLMVLFFAFSFIPTAGQYFEDQLPEQELVEGPSTSFTYSVDNYTVDFTDTSSEGDANLDSWHWDFGDGDSSSQQDPTKTYGSDGHYTIRLTVEDDNNERDTAIADIYVSNGTQDSGSSQPEYGDIDFNVNFAQMLLPLALAIVVVGLHFVMVVVGGYIIKAGWNLIKPKPETIKVRVKPKDLEVEPVYDQPARATYQPPMETVQPQPPEENLPPPPQE